MIEITELAAKKLSAYLSENNIDSPVRVAVLNGCGGPSLGLAIDERKKGDTAVDLDGLQVIIDTTLLGECGRTRVDFKPPSGCGGGGFVITSETPLPGEGDNCGGSCSSSSCGC